MADSIFNKEINIFNSFGDKKKLTFYNDLHALLSAGIDLKTGLEIQLKGVSSRAEKELIESLREELVNGSKISESLKKTGKFSSYEYNAIEIGEETGRLEIVLDELKSYYEQKTALKKQILSVLTYPIFVIVITVGVLYFMMKHVVPMFKDVFKQFGGELPPLTKKIIDFSDNFPMIASVFVGVVVLISITIYFLRENIVFRDLTSKVVLKIPYLGKLINRIYLTRFCQAMSLLTASKIPLTQALDLTMKMIEFYPYEKAISEIIKDVKDGGTLYGSMLKFTIFDPQITSLVGISEETNQLDLIFSRLKSQYSADLEHQTKLIGKLIEPLMIVIVGALIGLIMIAMYMPMFNLSNVIGQ